MTVHMTVKPQSLDTIVATNFQADILSDLAGSLGVAPTAKGMANYVVTFWTAAQMLNVWAKSKQVLG